MNYRSNLEASDLRPFFKHIHERVIPESFGHDVISDWADKADEDPVFGTFKKCGFWTLDESAILYHCAKMVRGSWIDVGSHTGWTAAHLIEGGAGFVMAVDPMYRYDQFYERAAANIFRCHERALCTVRFIGDEYENLRFTALADGIVIDGNHASPHPLNDAMAAKSHLRSRGVVLLHDYRIDPVKEAYNWLLANGFNGRTYTTPLGVAVAWRGDFTPPEHVPDPRLPPV